MRKDSNYVRFDISNNGALIPSDKLQLIFDKFYRMDTARSTDTGGAGLGLAIAKEIVLAHGGKISVKSENEMTRFTVRIPNTQPE